MKMSCDCPVPCPVFLCPLESWDGLQHSRQSRQCFCQRPNRKYLPFIFMDCSWTRSRVCGLVWPLWASTSTLMGRWWKRLFIQPRTHRERIMAQFCGVVTTFLYYLLAPWCICLSFFFKDSFSEIFSLYWPNLIHLVIIFFILQVYLLLQFSSNSSLNVDLFDACRGTSSMSRQHMPDRCKYSLVGKVLGQCGVWLTLCSPQLFSVRASRGMWLWLIPAASARIGPP